MTQDAKIVLPFARLGGQNFQGDFDGGTLSSDGGVLLLRETEARLGIIGRFVQALDDPRDPRYINHSYEEMLRQRIFQIACGYEDANDCDFLRHDPAFKAACDRLPIEGKALASQPTMSRLENAPRRSELYRMAQGLFETFVASYDRAPKALLLDIDDTADEVHGAQQQSLFNGYYDAYCYLPLHIYEGQSGSIGKIKPLFTPSPPPAAPLPPCRPPALRLPGAARAGAARGRLLGTTARAGLIQRDERRCKLVQKLTSSPPSQTSSRCRGFELPRPDLSFSRCGERHEAD